MNNDPFFVFKEESVNEIYLINSYRAVTPYPSAEFRTPARFTALSQTCYC